MYVWYIGIFFFIYVFNSGFGVGFLLSNMYCKEDGYVFVLSCFNKLVNILEMIEIIVIFFVWSVLWIKLVLYFGISKICMLYIMFFIKRDSLLIWNIGM